MSWSLPLQREEAKNVFRFLSLPTTRGGRKCRRLRAPGEPPTIPAKALNRFKLLSSAPGTPCSVAATASFRECRRSTPCNLFTRMVDAKPKQTCTKKRNRIEIRALYSGIAWEGMFRRFRCGGLQPKMVFLHPLRPALGCASSALVGAEGRSGKGGHPVASRLFRPVHGLIRVADHLIQIRRLIAGLGNAETGGDCDAVGALHQVDTGKRRA